MTITKTAFGFTASGEEIFKFTLENKCGLRAEVLTYGATIQKLCVPNGVGGAVDVVLGFDTLQEYEGNHPYVGSFIGRNANRLKKEVVVAGKKIVLAVNEGENQLHGGVKGFDKRVWDAVIKDESLEFSLDSKDGDQGFPGNLKVKTTFKLEGLKLKMEVSATTDQPTIANFTRHDYFNLCSGVKKAVVSHKLQVHAGSYTELDGNMITTGRLVPVAGTLYDFTEVRVVGDADDGFDLNYVLDNAPSKLRLAAQVWAPDSDITLKVYCTQPGLQFFSAKSIMLASGKEDYEPVESPGLCLEPQYFPNSPSHSHFPSTILLPSEVYEEQMVYDFE
ncbi:aldose epimerase family protein [uncultured Dokdonia sp.]|uniref:aldose epimerase family protein n=1 Tax=uncultured Dokdonia sp. TaxID=575653 RepID=UPI002608452B|nr:aldose epimerase family protein [uncultured Dokdonia sp.]